MKHLFALRCPSVLMAAAFGCVLNLSAAAALTPGARVAIIGDSITEQKQYSKFMETYILACSGVPEVKTFQYGWGGETASGFSQRLANDIESFKPTVATTCYGMNDGQYRPYAEDVGSSYEKNTRKVIAGLQAAGVKTIVLGSPGAVDTKYFVNNRFAPLSGAEGYNQSLGKLRDIDQRVAKELGIDFADVHQPLMDALAKAKEAYGQDYDVCGRDGVHPGNNGHLVMAYAFLRGLGCDGNIGQFTVDMTGKATATTGHKVTGGEKGVAELESTRYPFCFDSDPKSPGSTRSILPYCAFNQDLNRLVLKVSNLAAAKAKVTWGEQSKEFTKEQLAAGVNLAAEFAKTPFDENFRAVLSAVAAKQNYETMMIKSMVTQFRYFQGELKNDQELPGLFQAVGKKLAVRQEQLDAKVRQAIVPVKHTVRVEPVN